MSRFVVSYRLNVAFVTLAVMFVMELVLSRVASLEHGRFIAT